MAESKDRESCGTSACGAETTSACGTKMTGACGAGGDKGKCCGRALGGTLLGGIIIFAWFSFSWMVLPWHKDILPFKDEKAVAAVLSANVAGDGVYVIPYTAMGKEEQKTEKPFTFMAVKAGGVNIKDAMPATMGKGFVLYLVLAGLLTCLLMKGGGCPCRQSLKTGLLAGLAAGMPAYIWWHFPLGHALVNVADYAIALTLAGVAIAKCVLKLKFGCGAGSCGTDKP